MYLKTKCKNAFPVIRAGLPVVAIVKTGAVAFVAVGGAVVVRAVKVGSVSGGIARCVPILVRRLAIL